MLGPSTRSSIDPFHVMEVVRAAAERERAGLEVLHLEVGQPSTPAPAGVRAAARAAIEHELLGYTEALGLPELRRAVAGHYTTRHGLDLDPERVCVTVGASGGFVLAFLAAFDAGQRVAVTTPGYPCYRNTLGALGLEVVEVPVDADTRYQPTPQILEAHLPLAGLVVASPTNPAGTMLAPDELDALAHWCRTNEVRLISDEIYHGLTYEQSASTAAVHPEAIVVNSFSKYWSMTGWRIGWNVMPTDLVRPTERLAQNLVISPPTPSQLAAVAAFDCEQECEQNLARYAANREILLRELPAMGIDRLAPAEGAFYVWAEVDHLTTDSQSLCATWLDELGVATTPGIDFDPSRGHRFVRFSFAGSTEEIGEACRRLAAWCG